MNNRNDVSLLGNCTLAVRELEKSRNSNHGKPEEIGSRRKYKQWEIQDLSIISMKELVIPHKMRISTLVPLYLTYTLYRMMAECSMTRIMQYFTGKLLERSFQKSEEKI